MRYVFITQDGKLGKYVKTVDRKSKTGFKRVQLLDAALTQTVRDYAQMEASAENSQELWETLESIMVETYDKMTEMEKKSEAFKEIYEWFLNVGDNIAFMCIRKGISEMVASMNYAKFLKCDKDNEKFVPLFLREIVGRYSKFYTDKKKANTVLAQLADMTDEELKIVASEWQEEYIRCIDKEKSKAAHTPVYNFEKAI